MRINIGSNKLQQKQHPPFFCLSFHLKAKIIQAPLFSSQETLLQNQYSSNRILDRNLISKIRFGFSFDITDIYLVHRKRKKEAI